MVAAQLLLLSFAGGGAFRELINVQGRYASYVLEARER